MSGMMDMHDAVNAYRSRLGFTQRDLDRLMRFMDLGWMRHLPPAVALVLEGIDDMPRAVLEEFIECEHGAQVWEQEPCDDGESRDPERDLQIAASLHPDVTDSVALACLSESDRAEAAARYQARREQFSRVCSTLGVAEPKTMGEVYPFLLGIGVIEEYRRGSTAWVRSMATELDPIDVLRLDEQRAAEERACRGEMRFMAIADTLAKQFQAAGGRHARVSTSLLRLTRLTRLPVQQLRPSLIGGVEAGILTCNQKLDALEEHRIFELRICPGSGEAVQAFISQYRLTTA